jgi:hypothetical protein
MAEEQKTAPTSQPGITDFLGQSLMTVADTLSGAAVEGWSLIYFMD